MAVDGYGEAVGLSPGHGKSLGVLGVATALREGPPAPASSPARWVPHPAASTASNATGTIPARAPVVLIFVMRRSWPMPGPAS
ncbi:hypothetical protein ACWC5O_02510 [Streptomyces sp. NPDC001450]